MIPMYYSKVMLTLNHKFTNNIYLSFTQNIKPVILIFMHNMHNKMNQMLLNIVLVYILRSSDPSFFYFKANISGLAEHCTIKTYEA